MPRPLKRGILGASTIILSVSKDIDKYAFMCGSNFYESDVSLFMALQVMKFKSGVTKLVRY